MAAKPVQPVFKADWLAKVTRDLRGKPLDSLNRTVDGRTYAPFFHAEDLQEQPLPVVPADRPAFSIGERISITDPADANARILAGLTNGTGALELIGSPADYNRALDGVHRELIDLYFTGKDEQTTGQKRDSLRFDSLLPGRASVRTIRETLEARGENGPLTLWLRTDHDYFLTIAYLRAVRTLYRGDLQLAVSVPADPELDEHTNKIAASAQAMAAVIGGADLLFVEPSEDSDFGRRIARNVGHLLQQEAHLDRVADAAAGSYYLETLTQDLLATT